MCKLPKKYKTNIALITISQHKLKNCAVVKDDLQIGLFKEGKVPCLSNRVVILLMPSDTLYRDDYICISSDHTSYLSFFVRHHVFWSVNGTPEKCVNLRQKLHRDKTA